MTWKRKPKQREIEHTENPFRQGNVLSRCKGCYEDWAGYCLAYPYNKPAVCAAKGVEKPCA